MPIRFSLQEKSMLYTLAKQASALIADYCERHKVYKVYVEKTDQLEHSNSCSSLFVNLTMLLL